MKRIYLLLAAMLLSGGMVSAQNDPVVMTIAGKPVSRSEFEYSYNKNNTEGVIDKKTVGEYVDLFVNYKLKVQAALDAHLDTLTSFQKEYHSYRDQQLLSSFVTAADVEREAQKIYHQTADRINDNGGLMKVRHIFLMVPQRATKDQQNEIKARIDSIYAVLQKKGSDFAALAKKYSQDPSTASKGGLMPLIAKGQTFPEFENTVWSMKKGQTSKPVLSAAGWHIIRLEDHQDFFPYDSVRADIHQFIEARHLRDVIAKENIDSLAKAKGVDREDFLDGRAQELAAKDSNLKYLFQEYHDGLLLYEMSNRLVWNKAAKDEQGLAKYYKKHKKQYRWTDGPHFKGIAYHVKDAADVERVRDSVKGHPFDQWADILRKTFNNDSIIRIRVEKGIFKEGDNGVVDKQVFHKDTTFRSMKDYPIDATYGKLLKKGPECYEDVRAQVVSDYQNVLEKEWVKALRKKYPVEVNEQVLATVNKH